MNGKRNIGLKMIFRRTNGSLAGNGSRLGEVGDFEKLSLKFITNVK
jgi:hypothetical protein